MKKILIILGPTAVGKSEFGVFLAKKFNGEIISADSVQIYKGLDIGSAKITNEEMQGIKHHCIDILSPDSDFSVFDFVKLTREKIDEIIERGKLPIIVGGTGLYVKALLEGYDFGGQGKDEEYRKKLEKEWEKDSDGLYETLKLKQPDLALKIKPNDKKRIIRALEISEFGSLPTSSKSEFDALVVTLNMDRQKLYDRINERVDKMIGLGLVEEVKKLIALGLTKENQSMKAIGYKEVISFLSGEIDQQRMVELIKQHSRNYAKRQMTFFRSLQDSFVVDVEDKKQAVIELEKRIKGWLC